MLLSLQLADFFETDTIFFDMYNTERRSRPAFFATLLTNLTCHREKDVGASILLWQYWVIIAWQRTEIYFRIVILFLYGFKLSLKEWKHIRITQSYEHIFCNNNISENNIWLS